MGQVAASRTGLILWEVDGDTYGTYREQGFQKVEILGKKNWVGKTVDARLGKVVLGKVWVTNGGGKTTESRVPQW